MLRQTKAVLFDLDGTLVDSMWMWADIDVEYLGRYGYQVPEGLQKDIEGMGFTETAEYFKKRFSLPCTIAEIKEDWLRMSYDKYARQVPLKPGAGNFLRRLRREGIRVGIASSNSRELIRACLAHNGVDDCFDSITISCDVGRGKPAPDVYLCAAAALQTDPRECLVFEDVPMGIRAGKSAGMRVCAVADAHALDQTEEIRRLADYYITSYDEIYSHTYEVLTPDPLPSAK